MRLLASALIGLILAAPVAAQENPLAGSWKFSIYEQGQQVTFWLVQFESKDGKVIGSAEPLKGAPRVKLDDIKITGDTMAVKMQATIFGGGGPQQITFEYEGKIPKPGAKKIFGSLTQGAMTVPAIMEATTAKSSFDLDREILQKMPTDPKALIAIVDVIDKAKDNKVEVKDLQAWVDGSLKAAELYGPRFQLKHNMRLLSALQGQKMYASVGVETALRMSKQIDPKMPLDTQANILSLASNALRGGGEAKEADVLDGRLDSLETQAYADYAGAKADFKLTKFDGRKGKSKRTVLVELFTGAMCPPCVACDLAFDGLEKSYGPNEVVLLQYHMHIPAPEPMSNLDSDARFDYYADAYAKKVRGTPTNLFNGKLDATGGGAREDAAEKYKEYVGVVNKMLEAPETIKLTATAVRTGDKIAITAKVSNLDKPGDKVRLRLALVEDWVRFKGGNGLQYHHRVVRAMPALKADAPKDKGKDKDKDKAKEKDKEKEPERTTGAKGVALKAKNSEHKTIVDLEEVRASLNKYLNEDYTDGPRPLRMRNLSVVAFVQDDESFEVLQAVNVPVKQEK